ncbi:hypothetical protein CASFOL_017536 [Castilleja foliolosa]|uniref:Uncharacterized protein n=1 Tax=Castilleja foliolosa TaxID=1961234 RepID=A0ABD3BNL5_9LAMI
MDITTIKFGAEANKSVSSGIPSFISQEPVLMVQKEMDLNFLKLLILGSSSNISDIDLENLLISVEVCYQHLCDDLKNNTPSVSKRLSTLLCKLHSKVDNLFGTEVHYLTRP